MVEEDDESDDDDPYLVPFSNLTLTVRFFFFPDCFLFLEAGFFDKPPPASAVLTTLSSKTLAWNDEELNIDEECAVSMD